MAWEQLEKGDDENRLTGGYTEHPFDGFGLGLGDFTTKGHFKIPDISLESQLKILEITPRSQILQVCLKDAGENFGLHLGLLFGETGGFQFFDEG
ncbi:MAG: hypothetical protein H7834_16175, partial [Magnetococcus sp. YQC-9]